MARWCPNGCGELSRDEPSGLWIGVECDHGFTDEYIATHDGVDPVARPETNALRNIITADPAVGRGEIWGATPPNVRYIPARDFNPEAANAVWTPQNEEDAVAAGIR